jgi:hypothetical protein
MHPGACAAISVAIASAVVAPAEAGRGTSSLRLVGDDARVVVIADVARARNTSVFEKGYSLASDQSKLVEDLALDRTADTIILASAGQARQAPARGQKARGRDRDARRHLLLVDAAW